MLHVRRNWKGWGEVNFPNLPNFRGIKNSGKFTVEDG
jgi:hypothetical protein